MIAKGTDDFYRDLAARLVQAPHGERSRMISQAAAALGISRQTVYARLKGVGWRSGRRLRADKGDTRLSEAEAAKLAMLMKESTRETGKRLLSARTALEIARANGHVETNISPATALRILRRKGMHPGQLARPTPHTRMRSLHPNHVWQFDVSVCVLFYLNHGGLAVMDEKVFYKNKPENIRRIEKRRVLRYVVSDHYSGAFYVEYFMGTGETQSLLFEFLMHAFAKRAHPQDPFHGVPFRLVWDAGSANQSYLIKNLLDQLDVEHAPHLPGNPRAKGQVERTHDLIEREFEGRLPFTKIIDLADLNAKAHIWMRNFNATREHTRHGHSRYGLWQTIRTEQLRTVPRAVCESLLHTKPEARKVRGDLTISYRIKGFEAMEYDLAHIAEIRVGETVNVCVNPYHAPAIYALVAMPDGTEKRYSVEPIKKDIAGFRVDAPVIGETYRAAPDTDVDRHRKALTKDAFGAATLEEADALKAKRAQVGGGSIDTISYLEHAPVPAYMRRPATELTVPDRFEVEEQRLTRTAALIHLARRIGRKLTDEERAALDAVLVQHADGITATALDAWLDSLNTPRAAHGG